MITGFRSAEKEKWATFLFLTSPACTYNSVRAFITASLSGAEDTRLAIQVTGRFSNNRRPFRKDRINTFSFIPAMLLARNNLYASVFETQHQFAGYMDKESVVHHPGNGVDPVMQQRRIVDFSKCTVHNVIAIIRNVRFSPVRPQFRIAAQPLYFFERSLPAEKNHFHRQREPAQAFHLFGLVRHHDHLPAVGGHDLFPEQGAPTAFDQMKLIIHFIGTVYGHVNDADFREAEYGNAQ